MTGTSGLRRLPAWAALQSHHSKLKDVHLRQLFADHAVWQSWPIVGGMQPLEITLWIAFLEFGMGVFLFGGLLTRFLGGVGTIISAFQLLTLGLAGGPLNIFLCAAALTICVKGGGGGTMDSALGAMQRKSIERQRERDAEAARLKAEKAAAKAAALAEAQTPTAAKP